MALSRGLIAAALVAIGVTLSALFVLTGIGPAASPGPPVPATARPASAPPGAETVPPSATAGPIAPTTGPSLTQAPAAAGTGIPAVRIRIDRLGIDLPIVEGDGVTAPDGEAAHFPGSAWPDAGSNTYIYGHAREGLFLPLWEARIGDQVILTLVDETTRCFVIDEIRPRTPWNDVGVLMPTPMERLTLQTSTSYTPTAPRFVVIAHPCR